MSRLSLDFATAQRGLSRPAPFLGAALLVTGAAVFAATAWNYDQRAEANAALRAERDMLASRLQRTRPKEPLPAGLSGQFEQASAAHAQLVAPWDELFHSLESARNSDVALLSVTVDSAKKDIALSGEARNFDALGKFTDALAGRTDFSNVALVNHKVSEGASPSVVRFDVTLAWRRSGPAATLR